MRTTCQVPTLDESEYCTTIRFESHGGSAAPRWLRVLLSPCPTLTASDGLPPSTGQLAVYE